MDRARTVTGMTAIHHITPFIAGSDWDHGGFWWLPFSLLWLVLLGAAIWFVVRTVRRRDGSATQILAERYARSELDTEEYRERLSELRSR
jgi:putative membrane protein